MMQRLVSIARISGLVFGCVFSLQASALSIEEIDAILQTPSTPTWEVSVPFAAEIKDQGQTPYCGLYAMSSFLELWPQGSRVSYAYPPMDTSYLAMGYNRLVSGGSGGTHPLWLSLSTQIFGAIPKGSVRAENVSVWPLPDWHKLHWKLMPTKLTDPLLTGKWRHRITQNEFRGVDYLKGVNQIDFRYLVAIHTTYDEPYKREKKGDEQTAPAEYRFKDQATTAERLGKLGQKIGMPMGFAQGNAAQLYAATVKHLYTKHPVYLSINAGLTEKRFSQYKIIRGRDLVKPGTGHMWMHAVVGVAHCNKTSTEDAMCRRFAPYMRLSKVKECVVIQNSWGADAHSKGYVCMEPSAFGRIVRASMVLKSVLQ